LKKTKSKGFRKVIARTWNRRSNWSHWGRGSRREKVEWGNWRRSNRLHSIAVLGATTNSGFASDEFLAGIETRRAARNTVTASCDCRAFKALGGAIIVANAAGSTCERIHQKAACVGIEFSCTLWRKTIISGSRGIEGRKKWSGNCGRWGIRSHIITVLVTFIKKNAFPIVDRWRCAGGTTIDESTDIANAIAFARHRSPSSQRATTGEAIQPVNSNARSETTQLVRAVLSDNSRLHKRQNELVVSDACLVGGKRCRE
jgi:hypothetical protein